ncbi:MAG: hypothetical protein QW215_00895, partial [Ignisphaera sp.]
MYRFVLVGFIASSLFLCIGLGSASPLEVFRATPRHPHLGYLEESLHLEHLSGSRTPHPATSTHIAVQGVYRRFHQYQSMNR